MNVNGSGVDIGVVRPYRVKQPLAREYPAGMLKKVLEQPKFGRAKRDLLASPSNAMAGDIHFEIGIS